MTFFHRFGLLLSSVTLLAAGCGGGDGGDDVAIFFSARVGAETAACGQTYDGIGAGGDTIEIKDLRFYVSKVRLLDGAGAEVPVELEPDGRFQTDEVALVDLENGTAGCAESGNGDLNAMVVGSIPPGDYQGLVFELGVPFDVNHQDLSQLEPPLNITEMYWAWAIGHRFLRIDLDVNGGANRWNVHVGSTMCDAPSMLEPPESSCARPNRAEIRLESFEPGTDSVVLDLEPLLADSQLTENVEMTAFGCQSFPDDSDECTDLYPNLGMDFSTGACVDGCSGQTAFRVR